MSQALKANNPSDSDEMEALGDCMLDITGAAFAEVLVNEHTGVLHVNVNGICVLRICRVREFSVEHTASIRGE